MAVPASAHDPPVIPTPPAMPWGPGFVKPPSGSAPLVVAQRDHRGVVHIFTRDSAKVMADRDSPVNFLRRVSPALQSCIIEAAGLYQLPIPLVLALIRQESNFAHQAVSPKGAMGLMQLMPGTAASLGVRDPFDPRENILAGCRYFRQLLDYFQGNVPLALAGYNAGYHRVISAGCQVPAIKETQEFVTQVMGLYCLLEKHASGL
jgi:soluble lytic murein transglycosylase-like protein